MAYWGNEPAKVAVKVGSDAITTTQIEDGQVYTADLQNDAITANKVDDDGTGFQMGSLGLGTAVSGSHKLTVGGTATFSGDITGTLATASQGNITSVGTLTSLTVSGSSVPQLTIGGTTPTIYLGDSGAEDTKLVFRGNHTDVHIALDDSADKLLIGQGTTVGGDTRITINPANGNTTFAGEVLVDSYFSLRTTDDQANRWLLYTHTDDTFRINYNGSGGDELTMDTSGNTTFAGTVLIDGVSNYTGLEVKGSGGSRPQVKWTNANNGVIGSIYGTEANALVFTSGTGGATALTLDSSQNATVAKNLFVGNTSGGSIYFTPQTGAIGGIYWGGVYGQATTKLVNIDNHAFQDVVQISFNNASWGTVMFELKYADEGGRGGIFTVSTQGHAAMSSLDTVVTHGELSNGNFADNFQLAYMHTGNIKLQAKNYNSVGGMGLLVTVIGGNRSSDNDIGATWLR
jgi:hypothetical protein